MATTVITGDKGYGPFDVQPSADIYTATGASVRVNNAGTPVAQTGWRVRGGHAPLAGAVWTGGEVVSDNNPQEEWTAVHTNDGPGFFIGDAKSFTVRGMRMTDTFDGFRATDSTDNLWIDACWVTRHRDDLCEADNRGQVKQVRLTRIYNQQGSGHFVSSRRGNQSEGPTPHVRVEIEDCLVEMVDIFRDTRDKNQFTWSPNGTEKCRSFWKTESLGTNTTVLMKNNIIRTNCLYMSSKSTHALIEANSTLASGSGGNILVWRGGHQSAGTYLNSDIQMVSVPKIGGGTMWVPSTILGITSGTSDNANSTRIKSIFTFTDSEAVWTAAVAAWEANVWEGSEDPPDPPPPPPDNGGDPEPPPPTALQVLPHDTAWELAEGAIRAAFTAANIVERQGIVSKDAVGTGAGHITFLLQSTVVTARLEVLPDQVLFLDVPGIEANTEYELLFRFGAAGTQLYIDRELRAENATAFDLTQNTELLVIGANNGPSTSGTTDDLRNSFQGQIETVEFLSVEAFDALFGIDVGSPAVGSPVAGSPAEEGEAPTQSHITGAIVPIVGRVAESSVRAMWSAAKNSLNFLGAAGTSSIDTTIPADDVPASKTAFRANLAAIKAAIESVGSPSITSAINATVPADGVPASRAEIRAEFDKMGAEIDQLLAELGPVPPGTGSPTEGSPVGSPGGGGSPLDAAIFQEQGTRDNRTSTANALTPSYPATGVQAGDIYFAHVTIHADQDQAADGSGDGWDAEESVVAGDLGNFVLSRIATGSESGSTTIVWGGENAGGVRVAAATIYRYRGATGISQRTTTSGTGTTVTFPSVTLSVGELAIAFLSVNGPATQEDNPSSTWLFVARDGTTSGDDAAWMLYDTDAAPTNGTLTINAGARWSVIALVLGPVDNANVTQGVDEVVHGEDDVVRTLE